MAKACKKPDLNAPRYRPKKLNLTNVDFYNKFITSNPRYASMDIKTFKSIINAFNGEIWQNVIDERDGVELPEQLGYIFIGTCPRKKSNVDFNKSRKYGTVIQHQTGSQINMLLRYSTQILKPSIDLSIMRCGALLESEILKGWLVKPIHKNGRNM